MATSDNITKQSWIASTLFILTWVMILFWFIVSLYSDYLGLIFVVLEFVFCIGFIWYVSKTKVFAKLWEKRTYDIELVKERARLQAQREDKRK